MTRAGGCPCSGDGCGSSLLLPPWGCPGGRGCSGGWNRWVSRILGPAGDEGRNSPRTLVLQLS